MAAIAAFAAANAGTIALASAGLSAVSAISASQARATAMRLQAQQAELQGRQNALNYNRQAMKVLDRQQQLAAMARARAGAGGVDPLTGSPLTIQQVDAMKANQEFGIARENAEMAVYGGLAQSQSLQSAADFTSSMGFLQAGIQATQGLASYGATKVPAATT